MKFIIYTQVLLFCMCAHTGSTIEKIGLSFKPMSVAHTPRPRIRKSEGISMNAGGYCKCFRVVYMCAFLCYLFCV